MKYRFFPLLLTLALAISLPLTGRHAPAATTPQTTPERVDISLSKEVIDGTLFTYRMDSVNGTIKRTWSVNGQGVDEATYEEQRDNARITHLRRLRQEERQRQLRQEEQLRQQQRFAFDMRLLGSRKILNGTIDQVEKKLKTFNELALHDYYAFQASGFRSEDEFNHLTRTLLPQAYMLARSGTDDDEDTTAHEQMVQAFEGMSSVLDAQYEKLTNFFQDTVRKAITLMNDTSRLKELLAALE